MRYPRLVVVPALATMAASPLRAQTAQRWSVQTSALYATIAADVFENVENGPGLEVQLRTTPSALSIGAGLQITRHGIESDVIGDLNLYGVFLEPRWVFTVLANRVAPYVSGRLSYLRGTLDGNQGTVKSNGAQFNGGGGVLVRLTSRTNMDVGATYGRINFGTITKTLDGERFEEEGGGGGNLVVRLGLAFGVGK